MDDALKSNYVTLGHRLYVALCFEKLCFEVCRDMRKAAYLHRPSFDNVPNKPAPPVNNTGVEVGILARYYVLFFGKTH